MKSSYFQLSANEQEARSVYGNYIYVVAATGPVRINVQGKATVDVKEGQGFSLPGDFKEFTVQDKSGAANNVHLLVGFGQFENGNLSGTVTTKSAQAITGANSAVSIAATETALVAANADRKTLIFQNKHTSSIYIGFSGVTVANGLEIAPGGSLVLDYSSGLVGLAFNAISASGAADVRIIEGE